ncbi:MAG TPA: PH domain-containing protein [Anaerolineales bacterium]
MSIEQIRAQVVASVWQGIAQSDVDLSALPKEEQEKLVSKIADNVLVAMNSVLDDVAKPQVSGDTGDEEILWEGHPFLSLVESYVITSERIKIIKGLISRDIENFELIRVQDLDLKQGVSERVFGIGDITIRGHDTSDPQIVLRNVPKPDEVYEILRKGWLEARKRHGLQFREYM